MINVRRAWHIARRCWRVTVGPRRSKFDPDWRVRPGDTLQEIFAGNPLARGRLTQLIGPGAVQGILDGSTRIDDDLADALRKATGVSARFWLNMEDAYRRPL